ncbi:MAG: hypothetical protein ACK4NF_00930 [Planctomycetota bacterium]
MRWLNVIIIIFVIVPFHLQAEFSKLDRKFFKLLWKLSSIKKYKRVEAYKKLINFLLDHSEKKYIDIIRQRRKVVPLEQKIALENILGKIDKIRVYNEKVAENRYIKKCPDKKLTALDFLAGVATIYPEKLISSRDGYRDYSHLFNYTGITKSARKFLGNSPLCVSYIENVLTDEIEKKARGRFLPAIIRLKGMIPSPVHKDITEGNITTLVNFYIYGKDRKILRKLSKYFVKYYCLYNAGFSIDSLEDERKKFSKEIKNLDYNTCEIFLSLFARYILPASKAELGEIYKSLIANIKFKKSISPLPRLLLLERNLNALVRFNLFPQASMYQNIIKNKIKSKLNSIKKMCKKTEKLLQFKNNLVTTSIINYLKSAPEYSRILSNISQGCLIMFTEYEKFKNQRSIYAIFNRRMGRASVQVVEKGICNIEFLNFLACTKPLVAIRTAVGCRKRNLGGKLVSEIINYTEYQELCNSLRLQYYYGPLISEQYLLTLQLFGELETNIPKIINYNAERIMDTSYTLPERRNTIIQDDMPVNMFSNEYRTNLLYLENIHRILSYIDPAEEKELFLGVLHKIIFEFIRDAKKIQKNFDPHFATFEILNIIYFTSSSPAEGAMEIADELLESKNIKLSLYKVFEKELTRSVPVNFRKTISKIGKSLSAKRLFFTLKIHQMINNVLFEHIFRPYVFPDYEIKGRFPKLEKNYIKKLSSLFTLLLTINNEKIEKKLMINLHRITKAIDSKNKKNKNKENKNKENKENIVKKVLDNLYFYLYKTERTGININGNRQELRKLISPSIYLKYVVFNYLDNISKNPCNILPGDLQELSYYFRTAIEITKYHTISKKERALLATLIGLFPNILSSINDYFKIGENIYFTTLDKMWGNSNTFSSFCKSKNCIRDYRLGFFPNTSKLVRQTYQDLINNDAEIDSNRFCFYLPLIVDTKTKQVIISDFERINEWVYKMLENKE